MENLFPAVPLPDDPLKEKFGQTEPRKLWLEEGRMAWAEYQKTGLHLDNKEVLDWMDRIIAGEKAPMPKCHT